MGTKQYPIDIVLYWVGANDPKWRASKSLFEKEQPDDEKALDSLRYRDWGLLRFVFRGIEKYAPWVNKVYFVTCNQKPQ